MLFENGANVNAVEKDNWAALQIAASYGHVDVANVLIQNGADVNTGRFESKNACLIVMMMMSANFFCVELYP